MPLKLDRCVKKVSKQSPGVNPWAVCKSSLGLIKHKGGKNAR